MKLLFCVLFVAILPIISMATRFEAFQANQASTYAALKEMVQEKTGLLASDTCLQKFGGDISKYTTLIGCFNKDWYTPGSATDSMINSYCAAGGCNEKLQSFLMDLMECAGDGLDADMKASMTASLSLPCAKVDNVYCWPKFTALNMFDSFFNPFSDSRSNDTSFLDTVCHPCMNKIFDTFQNLAMKGSDEFTQVLGVFNFMCEKATDGSYCYPSFSQIMNTIENADNLEASDYEEYMDTYETEIIPHVCSGNTGQCFTSVMRSLLSLMQDGSSEKQTATRMQEKMNNQLAALCVQNHANEYCGVKILNAWHNQSFDSSCLNMLDLGYVHPAQWGSLTCDAVKCTATKMRNFIKEIGCCAGVLWNNVPYVFKNATHTYLENCGITSVDIPEACVSRVDTHLKTYYFGNLNYNYVTSNMALVESKLKADFAAFLKVYVDDVKLTLGAHSSSVKSSHLMAAAGSGTAVSATVSSNSNEQSKVENNANKGVKFSATNSLPASSRNDETKSCTAGATTNNSAVALNASLLFVLLFVLAALL
eukprot:TRINITY_DN10433_c0_g1_i1.p1 TRINITY_DN10433_c0_g1~~TRINITY_DN10433_c0_g1_i1.p1  ORF type:complete len:537 (+),score=108.92 TRINITY_DN10433_c0_g1_i1:56-1666(+)